MAANGTEENLTTLLAAADNKDNGKGKRARDAADDKDHNKRVKAGASSSNSNDTIQTPSPVMPVQVTAIRPPSTHAGPRVAPQPQPPPPPQQPPPPQVGQKTQADLPLQDTKEPARVRVFPAVRSYPCERCGKRFAFKSELGRHQPVHTGEKPYRCSQCGKTFAWRSSVTRHMRIHSGWRPFGCGVCSKRFARKEHMDTHMRTHTGDKPFQCDICNKRFAAASNFAHHKKTHREPAMPTGPSIAPSVVGDLNVMAADPNAMAESLVASRMMPMAHTHQDRQQAAHPTSLIGFSKPNVLSHPNSPIVVRPPPGMESNDEEHSNTLQLHEPIPVHQQLRHVLPMHPSSHSWPTQS